jgi:hypothetical protein
MLLVFIGNTISMTRVSVDALMAHSSFETERIQRLTASHIVWHFASDWRADWMPLCGLQ